MNTIELVRALSTNKHTKRFFIGVFASDQLKYIKKPITKTSILVCNEDDSSQGGSHWIAIVILPAKNRSQGNKILYFDSFGRLPKVVHIKNFIKQNSASFDYCKKKLQSEFSIFCGNWSCVFLLSSILGLGIREFEGKFGNNGFENDAKMMKIYNANFSQNNNEKFKQLGRGYRLCCQTCSPYCNRKKKNYQ